MSKKGTKERSSPSIPLLKRLSVIARKIGFHYAIDQKFFISEGAVLFIGWIENANKFAFYLLNGNMYDPIPVRWLNLHDRDDVRTHLRNVTGLMPHRNVLHGFGALFLLPTDVLLAERVRLAFHDGREWRFSKEIRNESTIMLDDALQRILDLASKQAALPPKEICDAILELTDRKKGHRYAIVDEVRSYGPAEHSEYDVSIIVPFFNEHFFITHLLLQQEKVTQNVQWIYVCDDPSIAPHLVNYLEANRSRVRQPTKLLILKENVGYSSANNIGVAHAYSSLILTMNSDIFCDDYEWLDYAMQLFKKEKNVGAIGFTLQFEDGTIQHDGMTFEREDLYEGLYLTEHPGKGLPAYWRKPLRHRKVAACTAALLLLPKDMVEDGQLFRPQYLKGGFEDSDLNLRIRLKGCNIYIVETPGLFHLERQSFRTLGTNSWQTALTLLNCRTFNNEWADYLDSIDE